MSYKEYQNQKISPAERKPLLQDGNTTNEASVVKTDPKATAEANKFNRLFLTVYALVMASDWLQGKIANYLKWPVLWNYSRLTVVQDHMYTVYTKTNLVSKKSSLQHFSQPDFYQAEFPATS